jgi:hypothetical protein
MFNSVFQSLFKRRKRAVDDKVKLVAGLPYNVANNISVHDLFTVVLIVITVVVLLVM